MYLTDIRGLTAESNIAVYPARLRVFSMEDPACALFCGGDVLYRGIRHAVLPAGQVPLCRITIHGMGMLGDQGLSFHVARFCRIYDIKPHFLAMSDMGFSFFVPEAYKEKTLDALCAYFPMWA